MIGPSTPFEVHASGVSSFKKCRRAWHWSDMNRQNLEPSRPYAPFFAGRAMHFMLEQHYRSRMNPATSLGIFLKDEVAKWRRAGPLLRTDRETLREQAKLLLGIGRHYAAWAKVDRSDWSDRNFEFVSLEKKFHLPFTSPTGEVIPNVFLAGRFDGIVRYKLDGRLYVWEIKTARSILERVRMLPYDEQATLYSLAASEMYGEPVAGVVYTIVRKKLPVSPTPLRNGFLSQNKSIDSTPAAYLDAIKRHHGERATPNFVSLHYGDILTSLAARPNEFFGRTVVRRSSHELANFKQELWDVVQEMIQPDVPIYPNGSFSCGYCVFRAPCALKNTGGDYQYILNEEFNKRGSTHIELEDD